ncbi:MAG: isochorismatase [Actinoallomurus sp.]|jgi:nicotinamidase-related amidase|nr:isochorismatase [Actinoallomurus sp.]
MLLQVDEVGQGTRVPPPARRPSEARARPRAGAGQGAPGYRVARTLHSVFYGTPLEYVLGREPVDELILAGQVTEQCVLYSALDAYLRHFAIKVPRDGVACIDRELGDAALRMMERNMRAEIVTAADCLA